LIIFIVAKNSGLKEKINEILLEYNFSEVTEVRGEDVPFLVLELSKTKNVVGITGEDLFREFALNSREDSIGIIKRIKWKDENFLFKKPALCLLGPKDKNLSDMPKNLKICINSKYKELAKKTCTNLLENRNYKIEKIYPSGTTEEFYKNNISDLVIDIVCTGKSMEKYGLKIYEKLFESDIVILGKRERKKFNFEELFKMINSKLTSDDKISYTKKLAENKPLLKRKIIEEAGEVITAETKDELIWEFADIFYFLLVYLAENNITLEEIYKENQRRNKETLLNKDNLIKSSKEEIK